MAELSATIGFSVRLFELKRDQLQTSGTIAFSAELTEHNSKTSLASTVGYGVATNMLQTSELDCHSSVGFGLSMLALSSSVSTVRSGIGFSFLMESVTGKNVTLVGSTLSYSCDMSIYANSSEKIIGTIGFGTVMAGGGESQCSIPQHNTSRWS